jgi:T5SS/PEP-CTERM-associated repeat protein
MLSSSWLGWVWRGFALALVCSATISAPGAAIWDRDRSGLWSDGGNWSIGEPPNIARGTTYITNDTTKTVTVDASALPTNLLINALTIAGPPNTTNTLRLADLGPNQPLALANNRLTVARGGEIAITNASLVVTGRFIDFNVWAGSVTLDSGSIIVREEPLTTNVTVVTRLGRTNAATLTINGGLVDVTKLLIGESPGAQHARSHGSVSLNGGVLSVAGELSIGDGLGCTGLVAVAGGQLRVGNQQTNVMRVGDHGFGQMSVANGSAHVGNVSVARHDTARGLLVLHSGGLMTCSDDLSIGRFSGSTGLVFMAGGELAVTNHPIWVGREGRGQLIVSNGFLRAKTMNVAVVQTNTAFGALTLAGGTVLVSSNFALGDETLSPLSLAQALVAGGKLHVTNEAGTAHLAVHSGGFTLGGGELVADNLVLTNSSGRVAFDGGVLRVGGSIVSNGLPFIVGNGIRPATLDLNGGTHLFANGLVISSNATLSGCGTIIGNVINHGTILTNCAGSITAPIIGGISFSEGTANLTFSSARAVTYVLEYKDHLEVPQWIELTTVTGTGGRLTLSDPTATVPARFYRLRAE